MNKTLNQLRDEIHANAVEKGFYDDEKMTTQFEHPDVVKALRHAFFSQRIALIHSELSEALDADREDNRADIPSLEGKPFEIDFSHGALKTRFEVSVKDTVEDELVDAIIRILDLCGHMEIDIEKHVELKMKYNKLREYKHEKNY